MISKSKIKLIRQLKLKKFRDQHKIFVVEGNINTSDFLKSNTELVDIFVTERWIKPESISSLNIEPEVVSEKEMKQITALKNPSDILAVFKIPKVTELTSAYNDFIIALENIQDPGNLGTIVRTADWFGIKHIICSSSTVDAYNPKVVQATMGSLSRINIHYVDLGSTISNIRKPVYGAVLNGTPLNKTGDIKPGVILIGSEAHGVSDELQELITHKITIPLLNNNQRSQPESLNASVACSIICYALKIST